MRHQEIFKLLTFLMLSFSCRADSFGESFLVNAPEYLLVQPSCRKNQLDSILPSEVLSALKRPGFKSDYPIYSPQVKLIMQGCGVKKNLISSTFLVPVVKSGRYWLAIGGIEEGYSKCDRRCWEKLKAEYQAFHAGDSMCSWIKPIALEGFESLNEISSAQINDLINRARGGDINLKKAIASQLFSPNRKIQLRFQGANEWEVSQHYFPNSLEFWEFVYLSVQGNSRGIGFSRTDEYCSVAFREYWCSSIRKTVLFP